MTSQPRNPGEPIDNLAIGTIIEVDGTHVVAELDAAITDLSRVFGGTIYPIGTSSVQSYGFILGRRLIYGYVCRLRMKSEYEREKGIATEVASTARIVEADLFGEGEWLCDMNLSPVTWCPRFSARCIDVSFAATEDVFDAKIGTLVHLRAGIGLHSPHR